MAISAQVRRPATELGVPLLARTSPMRFEAATPAGVRALVAAGLGVALLAASAAECPGPPVDMHEVSPPTSHPPFGILRPAARPPSPAAEALHRHVARTRRAGLTFPRGPRRQARGRSGSRPGPGTFL